MNGSVKRDKRDSFLNGEDKFSLRETFGLVEKQTGCSAPPRGELSSFLSPTGHFLSLAKESDQRTPFKERGISISPFP